VEESGKHTTVTIGGVVLAEEGSGGSWFQNDHYDSWRDWDKGSNS
jgi:hypothetical protein